MPFGPRKIKSKILIKTFSNDITEFYRRENDQMLKTLSVEELEECFR